MQVQVVVPHADCRPSGWAPASSAAPELRVEHQPNLPVNDEDDPPGAWDLLRSGLVGKHESREVSTEDGQRRASLARGARGLVSGSGARATRRVATQAPLRFKLRRKATGAGLQAAAHVLIGVAGSARDPIIDPRARARGKLLWTRDTSLIQVAEHADGALGDAEAIVTSHVGSELRVATQAIVRPRAFAALAREVTRLARIELVEKGVLTAGELTEALHAQRAIATIS